MTTTSGEYTKIAELRIVVSGAYLHVTGKAYSIEMPKSLKLDRQRNMNYCMSCVADDAIYKLTPCRHF